MVDLMECGSDGWWVVWQERFGGRMNGSEA